MTPLRVFQSSVGAIGHDERVLASRRISAIAVRAALGYALFGVLWIACSDYAVEAITPDAQVREILQTWKGWAFVLASSAFLFALLRQQISCWHREIAQMRLQAESEWRLLRHLVDSSSELILVLRPEDGAVVDANETACRSLGRRRQDLLDQGLAGWAGDSVGDWVKWLGQLGSIHPVVFECELPCASGEPFAGEVSLTRLEAEGHSYAVAIIRDVRQRKRTEQALRHSRERLQVALESGSIGTWDWNLANGKFSWDEAAAKLFGRPEDELQLGAVERFFSYLHPADRAALRAMVDSLLAQGEKGQSECRIIRPDGRLLWVCIRMRLERDPAGVPLRMLGACVDVTELRKAQADLERQRRELELVVNAVPAGIYTLNTEHRVTSGNLEFSRLLGLPLEQIRGRTCKELNFPGADRSADDDEEVFATGEPKRDVLCRWERSKAWVQIDRFPLHDERGAVIGLIGFCVDVTERKAAEQAVEARLHIEERLSKVAAAVPGAIYSFVLRRNGTTAFPYSSPKLKDMLGLSENGLEEDASEAFRRVHPDDLGHVYASMQESARNLTTWSTTFRVEHPQSGTIWIEGRSFPQRQSDGDTLWHGFLLDVTQRQRAEEESAAQLQRMALLNRITRAIGARQDLQSIFLIVARRVEQDLPADFALILLAEPDRPDYSVACVGQESARIAARIGMTEGSSLAKGDPLLQVGGSGIAVQQNLREVRSPFAERLVSAGLNAALVAPLIVEGQIIGLVVAARQRVASLSGGEAEFLRHLSEHVALAAHQAQLHGELQRAYNELRQTQDVMLQQERLRALGQMASGIAHDINNAISPVTIYSELLLQTEDALSEQAREFLEVIQNASRDVARTVARMREFYRQRESQLHLTPLQLNRLVREVISLTRVRWSDMPQERGCVIHCETQIAGDLPEVKGVESEIREALTNLILNAVDAMPEGGELIVRTGVREVDDAPGETRIYVEVEDSGVGMDEDTRRRCLEPFFTTKGERGTGLGLAMVLGVARRHDAEIEIQSTVGKGTVVRLCFPCGSGEEVTPVAAHARSVPAGLRILVVDDDLVLLNALRTALQVDGHLVTTARGGGEGIEVFSQAVRSGEPYHIVITDLGMPGCDGRKVAATIKLEAVDVPVILLTGWGERLLADGDQPPGVDRVLSKPPTLQELRSAIGGCLAEKREAASSTAAK